MPGRLSSSVPRPASDADRSIVGPVDYWVEVLEHMAADLSFGTFVFAGPSNPQTLISVISMFRTLTISG